MPWTFAHPAAVLPLRRLGRARLSFAALAIGSLTPDFSYYVFGMQGSAGAFAHSLTGSVTICVAVGLLLLAVCGVLRKPVCYLLPQPHRDALTPLAAAPWRFDLRATAVSIVSLIIGAWTHILWDSFTHVNRWFVNHIDWLNAHVFTLRGHVFHGYALLQYASSAVGVSALLWTYWRWLRRVSRNGRHAWDRADAWRYVCITGAALGALLVAVPWALGAALGSDGRFGLRLFVVKLIVGTTSAFAVGCVVIALLCYWRRPQPPAQRRETAQPRE